MRRIHRMLLAGALLAAMGMLGAGALRAQDAAEGAALPSRLPDAIMLRIGSQEERFAAIVEGTNALELNFCSVVEQKYCRGIDRNLNLSGKTVTSGITITPAIAGEWRWRYDTQLAFTPKGTWPAGQSYRVHFDASVFPAGVSLNNSDYAFTTAPLRPDITALNFLQDPNDLEKRVVTANLRFNYPVKPETVEQRLRFAIEDANGKLPAKSKESLPFTLQFNNGNSEAVASLPIAALGEEERFLRAVIEDGVEPLHGGAASRTVDVALPKEVVQGKREERVRIPSIYSYVQISQLDARIVKNEKLEPQQVIVVEANAPLSAEELKQHVSVKLLPGDKPPSVPAQSPKKDYAWTSPAEVSAELLAAAPDVAYSVNAGVAEASTLHSMTLNAPPGRWVYVTLSKGMKTKGGYVLGKDVVKTLKAPEYPREVKILSEGAVLALGGEKTVSIYALGAQKLEYEIGRVVPGNLNHLVSQSYGNFKNPNFNYGFAEENLSEIFTEEVALAQGDGKTPQFSAFDFSKYVKARPINRGMFFFTVRAKGADSKGKEVVLAEDKRFVLVTDLGLLAKTARDGAVDLFVMSIEDGKPVSGATVELLGKNGVAVFKAETDRRGHAAIPSLQGFAREKTPVAYLVRDGKDVSFMPVARGDREVNYSQFDTGGQAASGEGLRAFIFSDRGIYRPGETMHLGMIIKQADWMQSLEGLPMTLEITNSRGQVVENIAVRSNKEGFVTHDLTTRDTSPTGMYHARLYLARDQRSGEVIGNASMRVEEFLPDTMKITSAFSKPAAKGWLTPEGLSANVTLANLYGTPAADHRVKATLSLVPGAFHFPEYKDYVFYNAKESTRSFDTPLADATTDAQGAAQLELPLAQFGDSTYQLTFYAEGFEEGSGRSVKTAKTALVSPLSYVVGYRADGALSYIRKDGERTVDLVAVNGALERVEAAGLTLQTAKITRLSSLVKDGNGEYRYQSVPKETVVKSEAFTLVRDSGRLRLDTSQPGEYVLIFNDDKGLARARIAYNVVGDAMLEGLQKEARLDIALNKAEYDPGEQVELAITSPYTGTGLITIETDHVVAFKWFRADTTGSVQTIDVPRDFEGKGFVNVQFVRALDSREIYTPPFSYGVVPLRVSTKALSSAVVLHAPEKVAPGETVSVSYGMKHPGKIVLFAVDEGILQYGRYKTPDPLAFLVGNRALQVDTSQIFDLLMPEYSLMRDRAAFGGDEALNDGKNLNPFKRRSQPPVAFWSGLLDAGPQEKEYQFTVPDSFNGALRVMAVAVSASSAGAAEAKTTVRGDVIVSPNAPVFVAPGDEFDVTVGIANHAAGSGGKAVLDLSVLPSERLELVDKKEQKLTVAEGKESTVTLRLRAKDAPGEASLLITAAYKDKRARAEATLSVRPAVPATTQLTNGVMGSKSLKLPMTRALYSEFAQADIAVSGLPLSLVPGLLSYLDAYPYGCAEQVVSTAFPWLLLGGNSEFALAGKKPDATISRAFARLRELQDPSGAVGLWSSYEPSEFATLYALHFMIVAREKQMAVPVDMYESALEYTKGMVNRSVSSMEQARLHAYGIYLLTRAGEVTTNYLPYLLQYLDEKQAKSWKNDLAAVYVAASYKLMKLEPEAAALLDAFALGDPVVWAAHKHYWRDNDFYDSLTRYAQYVSILADHFPERLKTLDKDVLRRVAAFVGEGTYHSLSASYAVQALFSYAGAMAKDAAPLASLSVSAGEGSGAAAAPLVLQGTMVKHAAIPVQAKQVEISGGSAAELFYQIATTGFDRALPKTPVVQGMEISRKLTSDKGEVLTSVTLGEEATVEITVHSLGERTLSNVALVDLLPGGFELAFDSLPPRGAPATNAEGEGEGAAVAPVSPRIPASSFTPAFIDAREDRVILYGTVTPEDAVFRYKIKATNTGVFTLPPAYGESMYERAIRARGIAGSVTVVGAKP